MAFYQRQNIPGTDTLQNQTPGFIASGPQQRSSFAGAPLAPAPAAQMQQGQANNAASTKQALGGMKQLGGGILDLMGQNSAVGGQTGLSSLLNTGGGPAGTVLSGANAASGIGGGSLGGMGGIGSGGPWGAVFGGANNTLKGLMGNKPDNSVGGQAMNLLETGGDNFGLPFANASRALTNGLDAVGLGDIPVMDGLIKGAGTGASYGQFAGPYGALAGGIIGGVGGGLADLFGADK